MSSRPPPRARKGAACEICSKRKRRCTHVAVPTAPKPAPAQEKSILIHTPTCGENRLCMELAKSLEILRLDHTWLQMLPCRIGQDAAVDSAIRAIVRNKTIALKGFQDNSVGSLADYVKSVENLRMAMEVRENSLSDNILVSVALLCVCEALMQSELLNCFVHWGAMSTILLSRPPSWQPSEVSRAILYHIRNQTFYTPVARGQISPFDHPRWYLLQPAGAQSMPSEIARLKFLSNQLMIRLPRLILMARSVRTKHDESKAEQALWLATELAELQDESAENQVLHRIKVVKTTDPVDAKFMPFSFEYSNMGELEAAVVYWKAHIMLGNLRLKLHEAYPDHDNDVNKIRTDMERMGINAMMSHQYARCRQQYAHARGMVAMPTAWLAIWSLWNDRASFRGIARDEWREWNKDRVGECLAIWNIKATCESIDVTSNLLAGGPLEGVFVAAYVNPASLDDEVSADFWSYMQLRPSTVLGYSHAVSSTVR